MSLFSGGKDSSYALYQALQSDINVTRLVTVHPGDRSYLYHVPATRVTRIAAQSIGIPLLEIEPDEFETENVTESGAQGDRELEPLERTLAELDEVDGVTAGTVESSYQGRRMEAMCDRLGIELYTPLWQADQVKIATNMIEAGFEILFVSVAAEGLDESWLGRRFNNESLSELIKLNDEYGVHLLGEGGEFETLVVDGPHMSRSIDLEYTVEWDGARGTIHVTDARLV